MGRRDQGAVWNYRYVSQAEHLVRTPANPHVLVNYLMNYRLQWGQPDTIAIIRSSLDPPTNGPAPPPQGGQPAKELPPIPPNAPTHFVADAPPELIFIAMNDWPYSGELSNMHVFLASSALSLKPITKYTQRSFVQSHQKLSIASSGRVCRSFPQAFLLHPSPRSRLDCTKTAYGVSLAQTPLLPPPACCRSACLPWLTGASRWTSSSAPRAGPRSRSGR